MLKWMDTKTLSSCLITQFLVKDTFSHCYKPLANSGDHSVCIMRWRNLPLALAYRMLNTKSDLSPQANVMLLDQTMIEIIFINFLD